MNKKYAAFIAFLGAVLAVSALITACQQSQSTPEPKVTIAAGGWHTCAVTSAGGVKCWGSRSTTARSVPGGEYVTTPQAVPGLASGVVVLAAGGNHTCALTKAGGVKCWGAGPLGDGKTTYSDTPVDVVGLTSSAAAVATGADQGYTCALTTAGGVKCWGYNDSGRLGDGTTASRTTPVDVVGLSSGVAALTLGNGQSCALTTAGGVKCWGSNQYGALGDGGADHRTTPGDVAGLTSGVVAITSGLAHTCALTTAGGIKCWGYNGEGGLGDGTTTHRNTPVDVVGVE